MGILGSILDRILHHSNTARTAPTTAQQAGAPGGAAFGQQTRSSAAPPPAGAPAAQPQLRNVDAEAVLAQAAASKGGSGNLAKRAENGGKVPDSLRR